MEKVVNFVKAGQDDDGKNHVDWSELEEERENR